VCGRGKLLTLEVMGIPGADLKQAAGKRGELANCASHQRAIGRAYGRSHSEKIRVKGGKGRRATFEAAKKKKKNNSKTKCQKKKRRAR